MGPQWGHSCKVVNGAFLKDPSLVKENDHDLRHTKSPAMEKQKQLVTSKDLGLEGYR